MPRQKKPPGRAVDRRNGRRADLTGMAPIEKPAMPDGLCDEAQIEWRQYWDDPASMLNAPADRGVVLRWIDAADRYWRLIAEADKSPRVTGSTGQLVANPLYRIADMARRTIELAEKQLGIGALNRSNLGMAVIAERRSLADMNARFGGAGEDDDASEGEGEAGKDPRLVVIPGEVV